jgi:hypothetical protein
MRNPPWVREELILALDLYFRIDPLKTSETNPEILALSELLNRLPIHGDRPDIARFRNANGVYMKLCNFLRLDPSYHGSGLKAGSKADAKVWEEFANNREGLGSAVERIRASAIDTPGTQDESKVGAALQAIVREINERAREYEIGHLQEIRADLKGFARKSAPNIFSERLTSSQWAFHHGGRSELQFNVGFEEVTDGRQFRHGIAFSFEPSRTVPSPVELFTQKVKVFNDFMEQHASQFGDLRMSHSDNGKPSAEYMPGPIPGERIKKGVFVFLGRRQRRDLIDYELVLSDMDRLLPLYKYVESGGALPPMPTSLEPAAEFRPGCSLKPSSTIAFQVQREIDVTLRHNDLQLALYRKLVSQYGHENVRAENPNGVGTRVDIVVRRGGEYWFYEIKTALLPRACIREALGQILEYAFWPGNRGASRLVIVGETPLDSDAAKYLTHLKERFALPIEYESITI